MKRVVIIGAGSHGREVSEILSHRSQQGDKVLTLGFVDDDPDLRNQMIDGLPVLGDWSWFDRVDRSEIAVICASGFSETRRRMVERATRCGLEFANAVSPVAYVSPHAMIGKGVVIYQKGIACRGAMIGDHSVINSGAIVSHDTELGRYSTLNPGVNLAGNVTIGEGCYLGIGCSVIQGIKVGAWTTIGAGAAVIRDLPEGVTAVGVPAKIIKTREKAE
jgi:sugar O-acyltransferase (sialic acid O-acetyltransferase NeuD family)